MRIFCCVSVSSALSALLVQLLCFVDAFVVDAFVVAAVVALVTAAILGAGDTSSNGALFIDASSWPLVSSDPNLYASCSNELSSMVQAQSRRHITENRMSNGKRKSAGKKDASITLNLCRARSELWSGKGAGGDRILHFIHPFRVSMRKS